MSIFEKGWFVIKLLNINYLVGSESNIARLIWSFVNVGEHAFDFDSFYDWTMLSFNYAPIPNGKWSMCFFTNLFLLNVYFLCIYYTFYHQLENHCFHFIPNLMYLVVHYHHQLLFHLTLNLICISTKHKKTNKLFIKSVKYLIGNSTHSFFIINSIEMTKKMVSLRRYWYHGANSLELHTSRVSPPGNPPRQLAQLLTPNTSSNPWAIQGKEIINILNFIVIKNIVKEVTLVSSIFNVCPF